MNHTVARRPWSRGEELANAISHGAGFVAALIGAPFLLLAASKAGNAWTIGAAAVFSFTTMLLYLSSALHHGLPTGKKKDFFEVLDHAAIFLLIAGTYTPFSLGVLWGPWGWTLMGIVWSLAFLGVALNAWRGVQNPVFTASVYVGMGWLMVVAIRPLSLRLPIPGLLLIFGGGLAYTGGLLFYAARRIPFHHLIWHLSVLAGTTCHYFAVLWYVY